MPMIGPDLGGGAEYVGLVFALVAVGLVGLIITAIVVLRKKNRK
ncbi:hypothetical protein PV761_23085 [Arthrobacter sp. CC3]